ncbi:MAG: response regulator [Candidatus Tectomicrobia bacterium]|uniref:Response regulator n=1 Tax=Tectimicrobiota bacterium TaxID=2528274 RepID=A0A937W708_UNCTE|nr:response regulator [Candidatus Tectomicrobia bacterium]
MGLPPTPWAPRPQPLAEAARVRLGLSQATTTEPWRLLLNKVLRAEADKHPHVQLPVRDGMDQVERQVADMVNQLVAQATLQFLGCTFDTAEDGHAALACLAKRPYTVVLMDCQMPSMDGDTATQQWREHEGRHALPRVPIVALTASAIAGDRERCLAVGMDDHLGKPFTPEELQTCLQRWAPRTGA